MNKQDDRVFPRRLQLKNGTLTVVVPPQIYRALGWAAGNWVAVRQEGQEVILSHIRLGLSGQPGDLHKDVPLGKHGKRFRQENTEKTLKNGA